MSATLHLGQSGTRRVGMTKYNPYGSLHGDRARQSSPSILASPKGSSSDEAFDETPVHIDEPSDESEFGGGEKKEKPDRNGLPTRRTDSTSANSEDSKKRRLSGEPSNIKPSIFTSGKGLGDCNGSQSSQKGNSADLEEEILRSFSQNQRKKPRQSYGHGSASKKRGTWDSASKPGNNTRMSPVENEKARRSFKNPPSTAMIAQHRDLLEDARPSFKNPPSTAMMAQLDQCNAKTERPSGSSWREVLSTQNSQRDQRASQRSSKSTQKSSQGSSRSFKQPLQPSPKKKTNPGKGPVVRESLESLRAPTSSAPFTKDHLLKGSELHSALNTATDKLGISDIPIHIHLPPPDLSTPATSLDAATTVSSPLSSLDDSIFGSGLEDVPIITSNDIRIDTSKSRPAVCPMCKQPVDKTYLEGFSKANTRMSLRQQGQFCKAHKERSAESEWAERGYPKINWEQLDDRIAKFHTSIDNILSERAVSFYRNAFEDVLKNRRNKTLQESLIEGEIEGTSPGYYGGRGAKVMADNIMSRFASKLRRLAASDKLVSSGGVSRYVQAVLVPELAVLLIKDDMKLEDEDKAREVLRESVDIGNLLNEEEDEVIRDSTPKEPEVDDVT